MRISKQIRLIMIVLAMLLSCSNDERKKMESQKIVETINSSEKLLAPLVSANIFEIINTVNRKSRKLTSSVVTLQLFIEENQCSIQNKKFRNYQLKLQFDYDTSKQKGELKTKQFINGQEVSEIDEECIRQIVEFFQSETLNELLRYGKNFELEKKFVKFKHEHIQIAKDVNRLLLINQLPLLFEKQKVRSEFLRAGINPQGILETSITFSNKIITDKLKKVNDQFEFINNLATAENILLRVDLNDLAWKTRDYNFTFDFEKICLDESCHERYDVRMKIAIDEEENEWWIISKI
ncbi:MAG: hypothetical protein ACRCUP_01430 [Mycoplasmatales bacterium]